LGGKFTKKAIALGTFDGIHKGHKAVLELCNGYDLTVLTFRIPPKSVINGTNDLLMLPTDREKELISIGAKKVDFLDFSSCRDISANDFLNFVKRKYSPDLICCGFNFRFGKNALGSLETIKAFCEKNSIECKFAMPVYENEAPINSTNLRNLISNGKISEANKQILGGFKFTSTVLHGDQRGRTLGFPTINQKFPKELVLPKFGVYLSKTTVNGKEYKSITNLGVRPTFETKEVFCETYLFDFCGDIYGEDVTLSLEEFLREEKKFSSVNELKTTIENDISMAKNIRG